MPREGTSCPSSQVPHVTKCVTYTRLTHSPSMVSTTCQSGLNTLAQNWKRERGNVGCCDSPGTTGQPTTVWKVGWEMGTEEGYEACSKGTWGPMPSSQMCNHLGQWFTKDCVFVLESLLKVMSAGEGISLPRVHPPENLVHSAWCGAQVCKLFTVPQVIQLYSQG